VEVVSLEDEEELGKRWWREKVGVGWKKMEKRLPLVFLVVEEELGTIPKRQLETRRRLPDPLRSVRGRRGRVHLILFSSTDRR